MGCTISQNRVERHKPCARQLDREQQSQVFTRNICVNTVYFYSKLYTVGIDVPEYDFKNMFNNWFYKTYVVAFKVKVCEVQGYAVLRLCDYLPHTNLIGWIQLGERWAGNGAIGCVNQATTCI